MVVPISDNPPAPSPKANAARRFYVPQLDGLRFFAFLLVFVHHGPRLSSLFSPGSVLAKPFFFLEGFGWCGVDLFLVLSAFLITSLLLIEYEKHHDISLRGFYLRRILRIWPLYYLVSVIGFLLLPAIGIYAMPWGSAAHLDLLKKHLIPYVTLFGNFSSGHYSYPGVPTLAHLWTVTLEEQFYIAWPFLLSLLLPRRRVALWTVLAVLLGGTISLRFALMGRAPHPYIWTHTLARLDPLIVGIAIAMWRYARPASTGWRMPAVKLTLGLVLVGLVPLGGPIEAQSINILWQFLATALGFGLVLDAILGRETNPFAWLLSQRPFVWLGKLTYGLYVYHVLGLQFGESVVAFGQRHLGWPGTGWSLVLRSLTSLIVTILVAAVSYRFFESYFLRLKDRFARVHSRPVDR